MMQRAVLSLAVFIAIFPLWVTALEPAQVARVNCGNNTGAPSAELLTVNSSTGQDQIRAYLNRQVICPSACYDVTITINYDAERTVIGVQGQRMCQGSDAAAREGRGCGSTETRPAVTVFSRGNSDSRTIGPRSRCDAAVLDEAFQSVAGGNLDAAIASLQRLSEPRAPESQTLGGLANGDMLVQAFQALGYSEAEARAAIQSNQQQAAAYINAVAANDATQIASLGQQLSLNRNITSAAQQAVMQIAALPPPPAPPRQDQQPRNPNQSATFDSASASQLERARCAISVIESGSCQGNYNAVGRPVNTGRYIGARAYGRYQVMDFNIPNWTRRACNQALTPQQFLANPQCQDRVFDSIFSEHVRSCGSWEGAAARWFSGRCNTTSRRSDGGTDVLGYVRRFAAVFNNGAPPFGAMARTYTGDMGSPFSYVDPFSGERQREQELGGYGRGDLECNSMGQCFLRNWQNPQNNMYRPPTPPPQQPPMQQPGTSPIGTTAAQPGSLGIPNIPSIQPNNAGATGINLMDLINGTSTSTASTTPIASLLVQPRQITKGSTVSISWSSLGMSTTKPCEVTVASSSVATLARANEGSRAIVLGSPTTYTIGLKCTSRAGVIIEKSSSVLVE